MRKWLIVGLVVAVVAGAAYAARLNGIDLVEAMRVKELMAQWPGSAPAAGSQDTRPAAGSPRQDGRPAPVETGVAATVTVSDDITAIGSLLASETVNVAAETNGRVAEVLVEDGQPVSAGTALFRLDSDLAQAELVQAEARQQLAEANYKRNQTLRKSGNVAQSTFDAAATEREVARAETELARVRLAKLTITAPFSGTLGFRAISPGAYVTAGLPLVQLDKTDPLLAEFSVPELDVARIAPGQAVEVVADALPGHSFEASIAAINPSVTVNGRALKIRASLHNASGELRPGLLVRLSVKGTPREAIMVPEAAVVRKGESSFVYVADGGKAREIEVQTGRRLQGQIEITAGLEGGTDVVVAGHTRLRDGVAIDVVGHTASAQQALP